MERALAALDPADQEILRLKYYQGMTAREIAVSLGIPYETVKKRHQRGLKKLLRLLALGLVIAVLAAALAACAYLILRHLGFVPGYGVNASQELPLYTLEEGVAVEGRPLPEPPEGRLLAGGLFVLRPEALSGERPGARGPGCPAPGVGDGPTGAGQ